MKVLKYKFLSCEINHGTEKEPDVELVFLDKVVECPCYAFDASYAVAKAEAYNGEVVVEDDGVEEHVEQTPEQRIAELEEALELLLTGVTE